MTARLVMQGLVLAAILIVAGPAQAAEIEALITTAMKAAIDELVPSFERDSGHTVRVSYGPSGGIARRFIGGEPADVIVIDSGALDDPTAIASTGIGICVRKGAPRPDVSTPEALKRALLAAKSIAHTAPAGGGITAAHIMKMFERLGIAAEVTPK
jgi:molybdate transport system substrate-binding protein